MENKGECNMEKIKLLRNNEFMSKVCKYNLCSGKYEFFENELGIGNTIDTQGFFVIDSKENLVGTFFEEKESFFFINKEVYKLSEINFIFQHKHLPDRRGEFVFILDKIEKYRIIYQIPGCVHYLEEEEDLDFFQYLLKYNKDI